MAKFFAASDADHKVLSGKTIAIIGYGNQGRSQAINLRRAGHRVIVGNQEDDSWRQARTDGFDALAMDAAAALADVVMLLLPDEIAPDIYRRMIEPHLERGKTLVFASGYNITYKFIVPPREVDVILVAPRMIGQGVLELPARGEGFPVLIGVKQDASGRALATTLAIAHGIGAFLPHGAVVESSFEEETMVDLFSEHTWAGAMLFLLERVQTSARSGSQSRSRDARTVCIRGARRDWPGDVLDGNLEPAQVAFAYQSVWTAHARRTVHRSRRGVTDAQGNHGNSRRHLRQAMGCRAGRRIADVQAAPR